MKLLLVLLTLGMNAFAVIDVAPRADIKVESQVVASQTTSNTVAIAANSYRRYLYIRNLHATEPIYISFSGNVTATGTSAGATIKIAGASAWEPAIPPIDKMYLFTVSQATSASIITGN